MSLIWWSSAQPHDDVRDQLQAGSVLRSMFSCFGACCDAAYGEDDVYSHYTAQQVPQHLLSEPLASASPFTISARPLQRASLYERCMARNNGRLIVHGASLQQLCNSRATVCQMIPDV
jgi:hypothetical protein